MNIWDWIFVSVLAAGSYTAVVGMALQFPRVEYRDAQTPEDRKKYARRVLWAIFWPVWIAYGVVWVVWVALVRSPYRLVRMAVTGSTWEK